MGADSGPRGGDQSRGRIPLTLALYAKRQGRRSRVQGKPTDTGGVGHRVTGLAPGALVEGPSSLARAP